jgi:hypothetical protein
MSYIINQFVATAATRDEIPIVLVLPKRETMEIVQKYRKKPYQSLINFLEAIRLWFHRFRRRVHRQELFQILYTRWLLLLSGKQDYCKRADSVHPAF